MQLLGVFDVGATVRLTASFAQNNEPIDPSGVSVTIESPNGTQTSPAATNDPDAVGLFYADLVLTAPGYWLVRWESTGSAAAVGEYEIYCKPSRLS